MAMPACQGGQEELRAWMGVCHHELAVISEVWIETDSPNYGSSSNEWPWEAAETSIPVYTCTYVHTDDIFSHGFSLNSHRHPLGPSWLPPIGSCLIANWALWLMTQDTETHVCFTYPLMPLTASQYQFIMHTHTLKDTFLVCEKQYSISCCLNSLASLITVYIGDG